MKKWYLFDAVCATLILLFSFLFQSFNVGYYSYRSFLGVAIGSIIVGVIRNRLNQKASFRRSLVGAMLKHHYVLYPRSRYWGCSNGLYQHLHQCIYLFLGYEYDKYIANEGLSI